MALIRSFLVSLFCFLLLSSCDDDAPCPYSDLTTRVDAGLFSRNTETVGDTALNAFTLFEMTRPDSLITDSAVNVGQFSFPLNPHAGQSRFVMISNGISDTLEIAHLNRPVMESFSCGFSMHHVITGIAYSRNLIDTVEITQPNIDLFEDENVRIYIRPAAAER